MDSRGEVATDTKPMTMVSDLEELLGRVFDIPGCVVDRDSLRWRCSPEALTYVTGRTPWPGAGATVLGIPVHVDDRLVHPHRWILEWGALDTHEEE